MQTFFCLLLFGIFLLLSLLHFYWALGGKWGFLEALPCNERGEKILNPSSMTSAIVAIGLLLFAIFYLFKSELIVLPPTFPNWVMTFGGWMIPSIFLLRAIGDFKYVGFFKRIKKTDFGKLDTKLYVPLCLFIGFVGVLIQTV